MKINKEYPATHSMNTAWFASDLDGNVAIFQFNDDGPGPIPYTDMYSGELITKLGVEKEECALMPFTKEQIEELKSGLKPVRSIEDIKSNCNILINPTIAEILMNEGAYLDLCYSKDEGFYHLYHLEGDNEEWMNEHFKNGDFYAFQKCDTEIYFEDCREDQSEHRLAHFPFYVYEQDCCLNFPPERVVVPRHPFKIEQMPEHAKKFMFSLPIRFEEKKRLEPAEFIDSQCWIFNNDTKEVNGIKYMQVALTDGGYGYVKVIPHSYDAIISEEWRSAPRVIDKSDEYIEI